MGEDKQQRRDERQARREEKHQLRDERREQQRGRARGGIIVGLVLIALGIIFLLNNLFPGMEFNRLWPVIIIVLGFAIFVSAFIPPFRFERIFRGLFWITIGTILLLNTLEIIPFDYWLNLLAFWPVLIIVAGLAVLGGVTHSRVVSALAPILVIATLIFAVFYPGIPTGRRGSASFTFSHGTVGSVKNATASVDFGAGNLGIGSTSKLYDINAREFALREKPQFSFNQTGSHAELSIRPHRGNVGFAGSNRDRTWKVLLSKDALWDLDLKTGASKCKLDLSDLGVDGLDLKGGVGDITVRFGDKAASTTADINAGVSDIKLMVPKSTGVRLKMNSGITSTDFRNIDLKRIGGASLYETPDFDHAAKKIMLYINLGVSRLKIQGY